MIARADGQPPVRLPHPDSEVVYESGVCGPCPPSRHRVAVRDDATIAEDARRALRDELGAAEAVLGLQVQGGVVTITGTTELHLHRGTAERALRFVAGVRGVDNRVVVRPPVATPAVRARVAEALRASAAQAAARVEVLTQGSTVVLRGTVGTAADRAAVEKGAWKVPGVTAVRNELSVPA